jgi:glycosyltransferase involved in cell wall biosynthesis
MHRDPRFPASPIKRFAAARTFEKLRRDAAHIIFVSRFTAREFEARIGTPQQGDVVHHGIDHVAYSDVSASTGDQARSRFAFIVSATKEHKNLAIALDAWERAALPDWQLVIATPGDALRSSVDLSAQMERIADVRVLRGITDAELYKLYAQAGFVLVPSRYEGFGFPLLESMRMGAPVVSSTAEALVEVAAGALIPFVAAADRDGWVQAIRRMGERCGPSDAWQTQLDRHNVKVASHYTWDRAATQTAGILDDVLQKGRGAAQ